MKVQEPTRPTPLPTPDAQRLLGTSLLGHTDEVLALAATTDGQCIVSAGKDRHLKLWDLASGRCRRTLRGHRDAVTAVVLDRDGSRALSGSADGTARLWNLESGQCLRIFESPGQRPITSVTLARAGQLTLARCLERSTLVWDTASGKQLPGLGGISGWLRSWWNGQPNLLSEQRGARAGGRAPMVLSADGKMIVLIHPDRDLLQLIELGSGRCVRTISLPSRVHAVRVDAECRQAVTAGADRCVRLWDLETGQCVRSFAGHRDEVSALDWHLPSGQLVSGSWDRTVRIWNLATGECRRTFHGHRDWVQDVCLVRGGEMVVSASCDRTLRCWPLLFDGAESGQVTEPNVSPYSELETPDPIMERICPLSPS